MMHIVFLEDMENLIFQRTGLDSRSTAANRVLQGALGGSDMASKASKLAVTPLAGPWAAQPLDGAD
jgi:hypothetical protein